MEKTGNAKNQITKEKAAQHLGPLVLFVTYLESIGR